MLDIVVGGKMLSNCARPLLGWSGSRDYIFNYTLLEAGASQLAVAWTVKGSSVPARKQAENLADNATRMLRSSSGRR